MALVTLRDLKIGFRGPPLLDGVSCLIEPGQRIGLLGRNGSGKTTLLRMLCGEVEPDGGEIVFSPGAKVALLQQDVPQDVTGKIYDVVAAGVLIEGHDPATAWKREHAVEQILTRMGLPPDVEFGTLSSGMKRRVLLARALASSPDLLLLDEPTNHLDIEAIAWIEDFLSRSSVTLLFVTHDRMFLRKMSNRILEIDRGRLFDWSCDYDTFLKRKEAALEAEEKQNALFDKKLAEEEVWIRKGVQARRTRNMGRVRALEQLRRERSDRRTIDGAAKIVVQDAARSGVLVAEVKNVSFAYGDRPIFRDFSTSMTRGDKLGIIGPNGAGKTTLLRVLLGQLPPKSGTVRLGTNLQIAYFDQLRRVLDEEASVQENVGDGSDAIWIDGKSRHIIGYLQDFLFSAERARTPVKFLSGGERNRVLLAKLFAKPANVIVLDEPTNDLDAETLELLEDRLVEFGGTIITVSHDRAFLNNVVTSTLVFEADGLKEYAGGYDDYVRQRGEEVKPDPETPKPVAATRPSKEKETAKRRLTFKENQEFQGLIAEIERLETEVAALHAEMAEPGFYQQPGDVIAREQGRLKTAMDRLDAAMLRWEELAPFAE